MKRWLWLPLLCSTTNAGASIPEDCLAVAPLALTVRIGPDLPRHALLTGGSTPALRLVDATTGELLWSAGAAAPVTQRFAAMSAAFAGSFIALDTDGDGLHDRLYAGDLAGRLWRFDLHNGAATGAWASGGILADFSNDEGRGFLAPPDVSLAATPGSTPWFHIAIGTAAPGQIEANNRFYALRDLWPFEAWTDRQYLDWRPLRESDLLRVDTAGEAAPTEIQAGWYIELGHGDIVSASLTVAGRAIVAISEPRAAPVTGCRSAFSIATLELATGRVQHDVGGDWRRALTGVLPLGTAFALATGTNPEVPTALCFLGEARANECDVDLGPHRTWWRREDAE